MKTDNGDTCWVANVGTGLSEISLTVYHAPGGWRWLAHDVATGNRTGDSAASAEDAKRAAEKFARSHFAGDDPIHWNMAFVRRQAG